MPGLITALDYAWTLTMLPLGIFAMAISTAVFPTLADQTARDRLDEMVATLAGTLQVILYLTIPASFGLIVLGEPIVRLLLERGEFTAASTAEQLRQIARVDAPPPSTRCTTPARRSRSPPWRWSSTSGLPSCSATCSVTSGLRSRSRPRP